MKIYILLLTALLIVGCSKDLITETTQITTIEVAKVVKAVETTTESTITPVPSLDTSMFTESHVDGFIKDTYRGFDIHISNGSVELDAAKESIDLVKAKIDRIYDIVDVNLLEDLKAYRIFLDDRSLDYPDHAAWANPNNDGWQIENGFPAGLGYSVYIINLDNWIDWAPIQPDMLLHEFAHLYHGDVLGFDYNEILEAYDNAKNTYDLVPRLDWNGHVTGYHEHYGLTNHKEYFAELVEAYFGFNDFFPNTNAELEEYDSVGYDLLFEIIN